MLHPLTITQRIVLVDVQFALLLQALKSTEAFTVRVKELEGITEQLRRDSQKSKAEVSKQHHQPTSCSRVWVFFSPFFETYEEEPCYGRGHIFITPRLLLFQ